MLYEIYDIDAPHEVLDAYVSRDDASAVAADYCRAGLQCAIREPWLDGAVRAHWEGEGGVVYWRDKDGMHAHLLDRQGNRYDISIGTVMAGQRYVFEHRLHAALLALAAGAACQEIGDLMVGGVDG